MADKWDNYEALAKKNQSAIGVKADADQPLAAINEQIETIRNQEIDLVGRFQRRSIDRRAALEALRSLHAAQLDAAKHALKRGVDVEKERIDVVADRYIFNITSEYLRHLRDLGLKNYEARMEALLQLNEVMARLLQKADAQDVPPSVRDATIENIQKKHKEFCDRVMEEEIRLSKK